MKGKRKLLFATTLAMSVLLTACGSRATLKLPYDTTVNQNIQLTSAVSTNDDTVDFMAKDLCIVPFDEDQGNDTNITAISSLLFDITNQKVIYADNIYQRIYPASLTKLLTALVVLEQCDLSETVTVSYNASHIQEVGAKLCGLKEGDKIVLKDLLTALLVYSGNDAGIAIAEHVAGSEELFCNMMNEKAASIGAVDTHFTNSHGLHSEEHYTTAYDLYLIFNELLQYEEAKEIISMPSFKMDYNNADGIDKEITYYNTNKYLKGQVDSPEGVSVIGGKTGTTNAAGYCLELEVEDESGNDYIALILKAENSASLYQQMNDLMKKIK